MSTYDSLPDEPNPDLCMCDTVEEGWRACPPGLCERPDHHRSCADVDLAWAAGLFEGEGSVSPYVSQNVPHGKRWKYVRLSLGSTDEDVVRRFHQVAGCGSVGGPYLYHAGRKPHWVWSTSGVKADAFLDRLLPMLGDRRRARAIEVRRLVHG